MLRAVASSRPQASSAAVTMFEVGALTTITPALVAAETSTLSRPTPARATTFSFFAAAMASASTLVARADQDRVDVGDRGQQLGAVRAVAVPDLEVRAQGVDGRGRQLFSDEYDRFRAHVSPHKSNADGRPDGRRRWRGLAAWKTHDAVGLTRMLCSSVVARGGRLAPLRKDHPSVAGLHVAIRALPRVGEGAGACARGPSAVRLTPRR